MSANVTLHAGHDVAYFTRGQGRGGCAGAMSYYTAAGEPPGEWAGKGPAALGLSGAVDPDVIERLYQENTGRGGQLLVKRRQTKAAADREAAAIAAYRAAHPYVSATEPSCGGTITPPSPCTAAPWRSSSGPATSRAWPPATTSSASWPRSGGTMTPPSPLYRRALEIRERIGNQVGIADSYAVMGSLREATGNLNEAVAYRVGAVVSRNQMGIARAGDFEPLARLRRRLGHRRFLSAVLASGLSKKSAASLIDVLDQQQAREGTAGN